MICTTTEQLLNIDLVRFWFHFLLQDIEFVQAKIDDLEKQMKRSNDKQLKIEHELCQRVGHLYSCVALLICFISIILLDLMDI